MGIRKYKPTSPGRRFQSASDHKDITSEGPHKGLTKPVSRTGGRNNTGKSNFMAARRWQ